MRLLPFVSAAALLSLHAPAALAEVPKVIADIPATGSLVQQVLGDLGEVRVLLPAGGNEHHHQIKPSDAAALQDAELLVWIGPELTPWLARSAESLATGSSLQLLDLPGTRLLDYTDAAAEAVAHGADAHEGHDDHADAAAEAPAETEADDHAGHDHADSTDPHAWLDPQNGRLWLAAIADALSEADPENAATYAANAKAGAARIEEVAASVSAQLAPFAQQPFVVFHDAYGYFTASFGLGHAIPVAIGDATTPSAARLSALRETIAAEPVTCAFPEVGHDPALIEALIDGTAIRVGGELDPTGSGQAMGSELYSGILEGMGAVISDCLAGGA